MSLITLFCVMVGIVSAAELANTDCEADGYCVLKHCPIEFHFTQGLEMLPGTHKLIVSSGWYQHSRVVMYEVDFDTCDFKKVFSDNTEARYFAEGITRINNTLYQLTWREKKIIIWTLKGKN